MSARLSVALAASGVVACVAYVGACIYDFVVNGGRGDPYLIVRDIHFGYYHRVALAGWVGGAFGILVLHAANAPNRVTQLESFLTRATVPLVVVLVVLAFIFP